MSERYLIVELEALLLAKGKTSADIIRATGHTPANVSKIRNGKIRAIRLKTLLDICIELDCQPGDVLKVMDEEQLEALAHERARVALERAKAGGSCAPLPEKVYVVDLSDE